MSYRPPTPRTKIRLRARGWLILIDATGTRTGISYSPFMAPIPPSHLHVHARIRVRIPTGIHIHYRSTMCMYNGAGAFLHFDRWHLRWDSYARPRHFPLSALFPFPYCSLGFFMHRDIYELLVKPICPLSETAQRLTRIRGKSRLGDISKG
jgi:hypothetical protein